MNRAVAISSVVVGFLFVKKYKLVFALKSRMAIKMIEVDKLVMVLDLKN